MVAARRDHQQDSRHRSRQHQQREHQTRRPPHHEDDEDDLEGSQALELPERPDHESFQKSYRNDRSFSLDELMDMSDPRVQVVDDDDDSSSSSEEEEEAHHRNANRTSNSRISSYQRQKDKIATHSTASSKAQSSNSKKPRRSTTSAPPAGASRPKRHESENSKNTSSTSSSAKSNRSVDRERLRKISSPTSSASKRRSASVGKSPSNKTREGRRRQDDENVYHTPRRDNVVHRVSLDVNELDLGPMFSPGAHSRRDSGNNLNNSSSSSFSSSFGNTKSKRKKFNSVMGNVEKWKARAKQDDRISMRGGRTFDILDVLELENSSRVNRTIAMEELSSSRKSTGTQSTSHTRSPRKSPGNRSRSREESKRSSRTTHPLSPRTQERSSSSRQERPSIENKTREDAPFQSPRRSLRGERSIDRERSNSRRSRSEERSYRRGRTTDVPKSPRTPKGSATSSKKTRRSVSSRAERSIALLFNDRIDQDMKSPTKKRTKKDGSARRSRSVDSAISPPRRAPEDEDETFPDTVKATAVRTKATSTSLASALVSPDSTMMSPSKRVSWKTELESIRSLPPAPTLSLLDIDENEREDLDEYMASAFKRNLARRNGGSPGYV